MQLPADFEALMTKQLGTDEYRLLAQAIVGNPVTSIRLNSRKPADVFTEAKPVPWCTEGRYLTERPQFTLDPLLHAGCYYVQEASSMFISHLLKHYLPKASPIGKGMEGVTCLDLCAAPGGKSTLLLNDLPDGTTLIANEPIRGRAHILRENIIKWGAHNAIVTSNFAADFQPLGAVFDLILCDAPCSGEGMFRKDPEAIKEWSLHNVEICWQRQREIVGDIWPTLREGGLFIYSTCTYNHFEDEDNVQWIANELGADILPLCDQPEWGIREGHFFPHRTQGEGFFVAILRKHGEGKHKELDKKKLRKHLNILLEGIEPGRIVDKKGTVEPSQSQAMSTAIDHSQWPSVELPLEDALSYLHTEALHLPDDTPRGYVLLTYQHHPLGFCKNIGNRANNLYPTEWRIRKK
ncbi:MAG: rRNA cytosine-C5-methyltransferase [Bacteroidaceae bacterium]|nr:rRNA cytosine-C5-methyltransferase [Bacteroidaceae bacterium]